MLIDVLLYFIPLNKRQFNLSVTVIETNCAIGKRGIESVRISRLKRLSGSPRIKRLSTVIRIVHVQNVLLSKIFRHWRRSESVLEKGPETVSTMP